MMIPQSRSRNAYNSPSDFEEGSCTTGLLLFSPSFSSLQHLQAISLQLAAASGQRGGAAGLEAKKIGVQIGAALSVFLGGKNWR